MNTNIFSVFCFSKYFTILHFVNFITILSYYLSNLYHVNQINFYSCNIIYNYNYIICNIIIPLRTSVQACVLPALFQPWVIIIVFFAEFRLLFLTEFTSFSIKRSPIRLFLKWKIYFLIILIIFFRDW